jgi:hypothetical protein
MELVSDRAAEAAALMIFASVAHVFRLPENNSEPSAQRPPCGRFAKKFLHRPGIGPIFEVIPSVDIIQKILAKCDSRIFSTCKKF